MKKTIMLLLIILCSGSFVVFGESESIESDATQDAEIVSALQTEPDQYGIPTGIYDIDKSLSLLKVTLQKQRNSALGFGLGGVALVGAGLIVGIAFPELVWAPYSLETSIPWGYAIAGFGAGFSLYTIIALIPSVNKTKDRLIETYESNYGVYKE